MKIERTDTEIILTIPSSINMSIVQHAVDYLTSVEKEQKSKVRPDYIDALGKEHRKGSSRVKNKKHLAK